MRIILVYERIITHCFYFVNKNYSHLQKFLKKFSLMKLPVSAPAVVSQPEQNWLVRKSFMYLFQQLPDLQMLGTGLLALTAFHTLVSTHLHGGIGLVAALL